MKHRKNFIEKGMIMGILIVFLLLPLGIFAQSNSTSSDTLSYALPNTLRTEHIETDSYIFVLLKPGTEKIANKSKAAKIFRSHLDNIDRLSNEGKIAVVGRFGKNSQSYKSIFILNVRSKKEAEALLENDPAIKGKFLKAEIYDWYGYVNTFSEKTALKYAGNEKQK